MKFTVEDIWSELMKRSLLALLLFFCLSTGAFAEDYISPETIQLTTPSYRANLSTFEPHLGTYEYEVTWQGIPAATAQISVEQDSEHFRITTTAKTTRAIDIFYKLRYFAEGLVSSFDLRPVKAVFRQNENSRQKDSQVNYLDNGDIYAVAEQKGKPRFEVRFNPNNLMLDPISAAFLARALDWEKGETKKFDTFNGKTRYLISLTAEDKITMKVNGEPREVWVISPKVVKLTTSEPNKKLRSAKIYLTADKAKEILQIVSEVFVGNVKTKLVAFTPSRNGAPLTRLASAQPIRFFE